MPSPPPITEMAFLPFPAQTLLHDPSTPVGVIWSRVLDDVSHALGYRDQHWGYQRERPGLVWYLVEWESVEAHTAYATTPQYAALNEALFPLFAPFPPAPAPWMMLVRFPEGSAVWCGKILKVLLFYVSIDQHDQRGEKAFDEAVSRMKSQVDEVDDERIRSVAGAWAEELVRSDLTEIGECRVFVLAQAFPGLEEFKRRDRQGWVDVLRDVEGLYVMCEESAVELQDGT